MSPTPESAIHILDKGNYSKHRLVTLPPTSLPPLPPSSIRLRPRILGLTTNNLSYARFGHLMGWYDIYPLPPTTPAPFHDAATYGRVAAWGYADIIESSIDGIAAGQTVYGFLPLSSGTEDLLVDFARQAGKEIPGQTVCVDPHRQHVWKIYNRYQICPSLPTLKEVHGADALGYDALMQGLFATGYNMSTFAFSWDPENRIHPFGTGEWTAADAELEDAALVILNASGKTAMSFAYAVRACRPVSSQPALIIGVGSEKSIQAIKKTRLYDESLLNTDASRALSLISSSTPSLTRIVLLDFGARPSTLPLFSSALSSSPLRLTQMSIGSEVAPQSPNDTAKRQARMRDMVMVNASALREKGIEMAGETYFQEFYAAWEQFRKELGDRGLFLKWGEGVEGMAEGWEELCRDQVGGGEGLVFRV